MDSTDRGQTVVIGALLLLALLISIIVYLQVSVFPSTNEQRELDTQQSVYKDFLGIKSELESLSNSNPKSTVSVDSTVSYPLQPSAPAQFSAQIDYNKGQVSLTGAQYARNGSSFDKINSVDSVTALTYIPKYAYASNNRQISLDNTVVFENNPTSDYIRRTNQSIINGRNISIYIIKSEVDGISSSTIPLSMNLEKKTEYLINGSFGDIEISLTTKRNNWDFLERNQRNVRSVNLDESSDELSISLDGSLNYTVTYRKIRISSR